MMEREPKGSMWNTIICWFAGGPLVVRDSWNYGLAEAGDYCCDVGVVCEVEVKALVRGEG